MRTVLALHFLALLLLTIAAFAQDPAAISAAETACGPNNVKFDVKDDDSRHTVAQPEAGKALVYVLQDMGIANCPGGCITTKVALDGAWIGANHRSSYLYVAVDPGEHHLCASWQSKVVLGAGLQTAVAHFTAEAGKAYYFKARNNWNRYSTTGIELGPLDDDEAQLLMSKFAFSASHPK